MPNSGNKVIVKEEKKEVEKDSLDEMLANLQGK
jgi:hypothetical protein